MKADFSESPTDGVHHALRQKPIISPSALIIPFLVLSLTFGSIILSEIERESENNSLLFCIRSYIDLPIIGLLSLSGLCASTLQQLRQYILNFCRVQAFPLMSL